VCVRARFFSGQIYLAEIIPALLGNPYKIKNQSYEKIASPGKKDVPKFRQKLVFFYMT